MNVILVSATISILIIGHCANALDHCQTHQFSVGINSTLMQFTKEAVIDEYALIGEFKSLHCCAKGYRSIEW